MGKNAFADLGFAKPEAAALQTCVAARVTLAVEIERYIETDGLTQAKAAAFGVPQPTISKIVRGDLSRRSLECLLKMLARVGVRAQLVAGTRKSVKGFVAA